MNGSVNRKGEVEQEQTEVGGGYWPHNEQPMGQDIGTGDSSFTSPVTTGLPFIPPPQGLLYSQEIIWVWMEVR